MFYRLTKYAFVLGTAAFFATMWGFLIRRNLPKPGAQTLGPNYAELLEPGQQRRRESWGVYFAGQRIGRSALRIERASGGLLHVRSETEVRLGEAGGYLLGTTGTIDAGFEAYISPLRGLQSFQAESKRLNARFIGTVTDEGTVSINGYLADQKLRTEIPLTRDMFLGEALSPLAGVPELDRADVGRTWTVRMLNPLAGEVQEVTVTVAGAEEAEAENERYLVFRLLFTTGTTRWHSWVRQDGNVLIQGTPFGITLRREDLPALLLKQLREGANPSAKSRSRPHRPRQNLHIARARL